MTLPTPTEQQLSEQLAKLDGDARERVLTHVKLTAPVDSLDDPPLAVPLDVDYSESSPPPLWVIEDVLERETVNLWAGAGGSAKSPAAMAAAVAAVSGEDWLGRKVSAERVLYIDEENPKRVPHGRKRAL